MAAPAATLSYAGDMDLAIAIRTAIVGTGSSERTGRRRVVADSVPRWSGAKQNTRPAPCCAPPELVEEGLE